MKLSLQCSHRQYLSTEQKLLLKQVLAQRLELRHPEIPDAARGIEGMLAADALLKERNASGLLIGGLADAIWNQRRTEEELKAHKDTDVLVFDSSFTLKKILKLVLTGGFLHKHTLLFRTSMEKVKERYNGGKMEMGSLYDTG